MAYTDHLWTFQDVVLRVLDTFDEVPAGRSLRQAIESIVKVNRDIANWHDWQWYITSAAFTTSPPYSTGTVAYDASARTVTLTGGTWPDDAAYGIVTLSNRRYQVASRTSSTVITLSASDCPASNIASGTAYSWHRTDYEIPTGLRRNLDLLDRTTETSPFAVRYVPAFSTIFLDRAIWRRYQDLGISLPLPYYDQPDWFTVARTSKYKSGYAIQFAQIPNEARPYTMTYWREPRQLLFYADELTCDVTSGGTTVTASTGTFKDSHVGSMLRLSPNADAPTASWGAVSAMREDLLNPMSFQSIITSVTSSTEVEIEDAAPESLDNVAAIVSDPIDVSHEHMLSVFLAAAEWFFASRQRRDGRTSFEKDYFSELIRAKEADEDFRISRGRNLYGAF